ncbi:MAG: transporter substrate-binding domain-containing protein [Marinobacter sp.]|nr:transporter substrate-binding domain-containing protein [Marinobacter sp.]
MIYRALTLQRPTLATSLFLAFLAAPIAKSENLLLGTGEWPPYVSTELKHYGVTSRIVKEAFEAGGDQVVLKFFPWARALMMSEQGLVSATFPWSHQAERAVHHLYSDSIGLYGYVFFHLHTTRFDWTALEDLQEVRIGGTASYNYGDEFYQAVDNGVLTVEWVHSDELNWRKLLAGRIDVFPADIENGYATLRSLFPDSDVRKITHHPLPLKPLTSMHVLFPRNHPESHARRDRFNKGLRQLAEAGKLEEYLHESRQGLYQLVPDEITKLGL